MPEIELTEKPELRFPAEIQKVVSEQERIISTCDGEIAYHQGCLAVQQQKKEAAQKMLVYLKKDTGMARAWKTWPTEEEAK